MSETKNNVVNIENLPISVQIEIEDKNSHLVEGAEVWCLQGAKVAVISKSVQEGMEVGGTAPISIKDTKLDVDFGKCKKCGGDCKDNIELEEEWTNLEVSYKKDPMEINNKGLATLNHILLCKKQGVILPVSSGQEETTENDKDYKNAVFWLRIGRTIRYLAGKNDLTNIYGGDPINFNTGNFYHEVEDLFIQGSMPLIFRRSYNSLDDNQNRRRGVLGEGWNHNYETALAFPSREEIILSLEDGREEVYRKGVKDAYESLCGNIETLEKTEEGYVYKAREFVYTFNEKGELMSKENKEGGKVRCQRDSLGRLKALVNSSGETIAFQYNEKGKLLQIQDHTGRKVCYQYGYGMLLSYTSVEGGGKPSATNTMRT